MFEPVSLSDLKPAKAAHQLVRLTDHAALATTMTKSTTPYASLVAMACDATGAPLLLLSKLAVHTRNIDAEPRASLLISQAATRAERIEPSESDQSPNLLAEPRVTLIGHVEALERGSDREMAARQRFIRRHPSAQRYIDFADFTMYAFVTEAAHFIGGFARVFDIPGEELGMPPLLSCESEGDAVSAVNAHVRFREHLRSVSPGLHSIDADQPAKETMATTDDFAVDDQRRGLLAQSLNVSDAEPVDLPEPHCIGIDAGGFDARVADQSARVMWPQPHRSRDGLMQFI
ncbi:MAG: hypothetical protein AAGG72_08020, partial [Pseudomonadota bacterium]